MTMADMASVNLIGRMGKPAETTQTPKSSVATFSIACNGFKEGSVSWFNCEAWGKTGEFIQKYGDKGKQVGVDGTIRIDKWKDQDGNNREKIVVTVDNIQLIGKKGEDTVEANGGQDDIPF
jgi:single-strand DNA-binding protein